MRLPPEGGGIFARKCRKEFAFPKLTSWSFWGGGSPKLAGAILLSIHALWNSGRDVLGSGRKHPLFIKTPKKLFVKVFDQPFSKKVAGVQGVEPPVRGSRWQSPGRPRTGENPPLKISQISLLFPCFVVHYCRKQHQRKVRTLWRKL